METEDGYRLALHRLPRPASTRVMLLQHGVADRPAPPPPPPNHHHHTRRAGVDRRVTPA